MTLAKLPNIPNKLRTKIISILTRLLNHLNETAARKYGSIAARNATKAFGNGITTLKTTKPGWLDTSIAKTGIQHFTGNGSLAAQSVSSVAQRAVNITYVLPVSFKKFVVNLYTGGTFISTLSGGMLSFNYLCKNDPIALGFMAASTIIDGRNHALVAFFAKNVTDISIPTYWDFLSLGCKHIVKMRRGSQGDFISILEMCGMLKYWYFKC
jgi:hypothetical protein